MKRIFFVILCLSTQIIFASPRKSNDDIRVKINYNLPRTVIDFKINMERTVYRKGVFALYAEKYLGVSSENIIKEDSESWSLKSVRIDKHHEIDPSAFYSIEMKENYSALKLNLTPEGFLAGFNSRYDNSIDFKKTEFFSKKSKEINSPVLEHFCIDRPFLIIQDSVTKDEDGTKANGKVKGVRVLKTLEQKAADAAHHLFKLRKRRFKILSCNYDHLPADGKSYKVIVDQLNALESKYLELFLGKTEVNIETRNYSYTPSKDEEKAIIARYSVEKGLLDSKHIAGVPVTAKIINVNFNENSNAILTTQVIEGRNLYYRVPATADIEVLDGDSLVGKMNIIVPQLGVIAKISTDVLVDKKLSIDFYSENGSIKNIYKSSDRVIKN